MQNGLRPRYCIASVVAADVTLLQMKPARKTKPLAPKESGRPRSVLLALLFAVFTSVAIYSFSFVASVDESVQPLGLPVAIAIGITLFLLGYSTSDHVQKGYVAVALALLPAIYSWSVSSVAKKVVISMALLGASAAAYLLGPSAVRSYVVACDEAAYVRLVGEPHDVPCTGEKSWQRWVRPWALGRREQLTCLDARRREWIGSLNEELRGACGARPLDASYVENGIAPPLALDTVEGSRTVAGIARIRRALSEGPHAVPSRKFSNRLLFATWNIRDLGVDRFGWGERTLESYAYIAEVISHFDVVAIQEIRDRQGIDRILSLLGGDYAVALGFTAPGLAGNRERQGFIYDRRKVRVGELSSTLVIDPGDIVLPGTGQPARPPFVTEFQLPADTLIAATIHIFYGDAHGDRRQRRLDELRAVARWMTKSVLKSFPDRLSVLAGDLNVPLPDSPEFAILLEEGLRTDEALGRAPSDAGGLHPYDQIMIPEALAKRFPFGRVGTVPIFDLVYRDGDVAEYKVEMQRTMEAGSSTSPSDAEQSYRRFRTFRMSDHFPKWVEFQFEVPAATEAQ